MSLVSLNSALRQLRMGDEADLVEVAEMLSDAHNWAIDIMGANYDSDWTETTVPGRVRRAILCYLTAIHDDDADGKYLALANSQIERWRDHTLA